MTRANLIMHSVAVLMLVAVTLWGAQLYAHLPDVIPTHWNAAGEADSFSAKSIWSAFGTLMIAAATVFGVLLLQSFMARSSSFVPSEHRAYGLLFGYTNLWLSVLFGSVALMSWYDAQTGPLFIILAVMGGLPMLLIIGLHLPAIMRERKALTPAGDPSQDPKHWVWGGMFYSNPADERTWVPRAPHTGVGLTVNLSSSGGRLFVVLLVVVLLGTIVLPFVLP